MRQSSTYWTRWIRENLTAWACSDNNNTDFRLTTSSVKKFISEFLFRKNLLKDLLALAFKAHCLGKFF